MYDQNTTVLNVLFCVSDFIYKQCIFASQVLTAITMLLKKAIKVCIFAKPNVRLAFLNYRDILFGRASATEKSINSENKCWIQGMYLLVPVLYNQLIKLDIPTGCD